MICWQDRMRNITEPNRHVWFPSSGVSRNSLATQNWHPKVFDNGIFAPLLKNASMTRAIELIQVCTVDTAA
jgi:hypothetical protein